MRFLIFLAVLFLGLPALANKKNACSVAEVSCEGEVLIETVFTPDPIPRTAMVIINQENPLSQVTAASVHISIGGNPISYTGPLYLKGEQEHVAVDPHTNERAQFVLNVSDDQKQLEFSMTMVSEDGQPGVVVRTSTLLCE